MAEVQVLLRGAAGSRRVATLSPGTIAFCDMARRIEALGDVLRAGSRAGDDDSTIYDYAGARRIVEEVLGEGHPVAGPLAAYLVNALNGWVPDPNEAWFADLVAHEPSVKEALA